MRDFIVQTHNSLARDHFAVWIGERLHNGRVALARCVEDDIEFAVPDDPAVEPPPTLRMPRELAEELWLALGRELNLAPHQHNHTREDFEHERGRVDRLIEALIGEGWS